MTKAEIDTGMAERLKSDLLARSQVLASRIWEGQSPDLPRKERLDRVKAGLEAQGLSMDGVTL